MRGRDILYDAVETWWIERNKRLPRRELHQQFVAKFDRADVSQQNLTSLCKRNGWVTGRTGCFEKGAVPLNKGRKMPFNANCARTQFKKGSLSGRAKEIAKPIGATRLSKEGYPEIKIHNGLPMQSRWRATHLVNWEKLHGPIPQGQCLKCKGERANSDPSNWELVSKGVVPRLSGRWGRGYDEAPNDLKPTIMAVAKLQQHLHERKAA